jgi:hypothetical protein
MGKYAEPLARAKEQLTYLVAEWRARLSAQRGQAKTAEEMLQHEEEEEAFAEAIAAAGAAGAEGQQGGFDYEACEDEEVRKQVRNRDW